MPIHRIATSRHLEGAEIRHGRVENILITPFRVWLEKPLAACSHQACRAFSELPNLRE